MQVNNQKKLSPTGRPDGCSDDSGPSVWSVGRNGCRFWHSSRRDVAATRVAPPQESNVALR